MIELGNITLHLVGYLSFPTMPKQERAGTWEVGLVSGGGGYCDP